ncbi:MAG: 50S ribosomal protein L21 [Holosporaceae bacterium]|jgi:large subunit ribosomal protein L21|nr:50S ribosomal protein L21 [Holosporaceae bacterium]
MFAVIKTGGRQYKVKEGNFISVEKLSCEAGTKMDISEVLMLDDGEKTRVGDPFVEGATVSVDVVEHKRQKTVLVFKKRRRKNYRRKNGHRQPVTILKVESIRH